MTTKTALIRVVAAASLAVTLVACRQAAVAPEPQTELPSRDITHWTDVSEVFMEHPVLVAGQTARFAVHLTRMQDFTPFTAGRPRLEFVPEAGGPVTTLPGNEPSRPGAFRVEGVVPPAGRYHWVLRVDAPDLSDSHDLGTVTIFADAAAAVAADGEAPADDPTAIAYLKEQQWTNEFGTERVRDAPVRPTVRVSGVIEPVAGGDVVMSAPVAGRFVAGPDLAVGAGVRQGQAVGRIEPRLAELSDRATLQSDVAEATAALDAASAEQARADRLFQEQAVPQRRVEDARRSAGVAQAKLDAAVARLAQRDETLRTGGGAASGNTFMLIAPISGRVVAVSAVSGGSYDAGATLLRIVRTDRVKVTALVPVADVPTARLATGLAIEVPGQSEPLPIAFDRRHDSGVLDPDSSALAMHFDVANPSGALLIGQSGSVVLYLPTVDNRPVVPKSAVLMEAGRAYVFVQLRGERFVRRPIEVDARDGDLLAVRSGLVTGDRVVTRGAYEVQLASAAKGLPAEGHVH